MSLTLPWSTGLVEKAVDEHGHGVRQCIVMELVVLLRVLDVVEVDEMAVVESYSVALFGSVQTRPCSPVVRVG